jgi:ComF family protein
MPEGQMFEMLCDQCFLAIPQVVPDKWPQKSFKRAVYYGSYENAALHILIYHFKYRGIKSLAYPLGELIARALEDAGIERLSATHRVVISYIPLSPIKERWRGYNQSRLLAEYVGQYFSFPVVPLLARPSLTPSQASLPRKEDRTHNILNAFTPLVDTMPHSVLLVDDVITSGSTLDAATLQLKKYGAAIVWVVTAAGVARHHQS